MYPRLVIDINKLRSNLDAVAHITKEEGNCSLMIVTKGLCADKEMVQMVAQHPSVDFVSGLKGKEYQELCRGSKEKRKENRAFENSYA